MPSIPRNNLAERMQKLGYNPNIVKINPPVIDNSNIIIRQDTSKSSTSYQERSKQETKFKPLETVNIDEWSDFEEDI